MVNCAVLLVFTVCVYVNETLYDLYSPNIWVIKSRRMRRAGHVVSVRERRGAYRVLVGKPE
jgi:hypothetical protein